MDDYVITRVRFNSAGTHIEEVEMYEHTGTELTNPHHQEPQQRCNLNRLRPHLSCTATKNSDGTYAYGAEVKVVTMRTEKFIKQKLTASRRTTSTISRPSDRLGNGIVVDPFDWLSLVGRMFPRLVAIILVVAFIGFPRTADAVFMWAVHVRAEQITSEFDRGLDPCLLA